MKYFTMVAVLLMPAAVLAQEPVDLSGGWNVTSKPTLDTCEGAKAKTRVEQWLLAQDGSDISVQVIGNKTFPKLAGERGPKTELIVAGRSKDAVSGYMSFIYTLIHYSLEMKLGSTGEFDQLEGIMFITSMDKRQVACVTVYEVSAKKQ